MKHWKYLKYLLKHKWYVAIECWKCGLYIHAFTHDLSKFRPSEWFPYVEYFYGKTNDLKQTEPDDYRYWTARMPVERAFDFSWLKHQKRNKHHWQYWVLHEDSGALKTLPLPYNILLQMACDWIGASKAIRGKDASPVEWYTKVKDNTIMNDESRKDFETMIGVPQ